MSLGESDSGKTYTFAGGNSSDEGIVPLLFEHVFKVVSEGATTVFFFFLFIRQPIFLCE